MCLFFASQQQISFSLLVLCAFITTSRASCYSPSSLEISNSDRNSTIASGNHQRHVTMIVANSNSDNSTEKNELQENDSVSISSCAYDSIQVKYKDDNIINMLQPDDILIYISDSIDDATNNHKISKMLTTTTTTESSEATTTRTTTMTTCSNCNIIARKIVSLCSSNSTIATFQTEFATLDDIFSRDLHSPHTPTIEIEPLFGCAHFSSSSPPAPSSLSYYDIRNDVNAKNLTSTNNRNDNDISTANRYDGSENVVVDNHRRGSNKNNNKIHNQDIRNQQQKKKQRRSRQLRGIKEPLLYAPYYSSSPMVKQVHLPRGKQSRTLQYTEYKNSDSTANNNPQDSNRNPQGSSNNKPQGSSNNNHQGSSNNKPQGSSNNNHQGSTNNKPNDSSNNKPQGSSGPQDDPNDSTESTEAPESTGSTGSFFNTNTKQPWNDGSCNPDCDDDGVFCDTIPLSFICFVTNPLGTILYNDSIVGKVAFWLWYAFFLDLDDLRQRRKEWKNYDDTSNENDEMDSINDNPSRHRELLSSLIGSNRIGAASAINAASVDETKNNNNDLQESEVMTVTTALGTITTAPLPVTAHAVAQNSNMLSVFLYIQTKLLEHKDENILMQKSWGTK